MTPKPKLVEEAAAVAESMQEQANTLMKAVSMFKLEATSGHQNGTAEPAQHVASPSPAKRRTISATAIARVKHAPKLAKAADDSKEWKEL